MLVKLVGAQRYVDVRISEEVLQQGAVVEVTESLAGELLEEVVRDALNNEHPLFVVVERGAMDDEASTATAKAKPRTRAPKVVDKN